VRIPGWRGWSGPANREIKPGRFPSGARGYGKLRCPIL
jgi:hypothetical protein